MKNEICVPAKIILTTLGVGVLFLVAHSLLSLKAIIARQLP